MNRKLFFIMFLFSSILANAQVYSLRIGKALKTDSSPIKTIGIFDNYLYSINKLKGDYYLVKYEMDSLKPISYNLLDLKYQSKSMVYSDFMEIQGHLYLFCRFNNKSQKKSYFLYQEYSKDNLKKIGNIKIWSDTNPDKPSKFKQPFLSNISEDKSKKIIFNYTSVKQGVLLSMFAQDSIDNWQDSITISTNQHPISILEVHSSNDAKVYLLAQEVVEKRMGVNYYRNIIITYNHSTNEIKTQAINTGKSQILDMRMFVTKQNKVLCVAISHNSSKKPYNFVETYLYSEESGDFEKQNEEPIKTYNRYREETQKKKNTPIFVSKSIQQLDGNKVLFTAEQRHIVPIITSLPPITSFAYLNITTFTIDYKGHFIETDDINKRQFLTKGRRGQHTNYNDYYSPIYSAALSYSVSTFKGKAYILYNENIKNIGTAEWNISFVNDVDNSVPILALFQPQKQIEKYVLQTNNDPRLMLLLNTTFQYNNKLYCFAKQEQSMVITEFTLY